jgi:uncharacterized protein
MKAARAILLALLLGWVFPALTTSLAPALANVAVPPLVGRVVDQTGTLGSGDVASLNQTLRNFEARKGSQIAVLIVPTTEGEAIEQFSLRVAETWKIGRKKIDDGALLVIAKNDRHLRIEVGYGLEGAVTDVTSKRIIDEIITPKFKAGDFAGGISAGINRIIRVIEAKTAGRSRRIGKPRTCLIPSTRSIPLPCSGLFIFGAVMRGLFAVARRDGHRRYRRRAGMVRLRIARAALWQASLFHDRIGCRDHGVCQSGRGPTAP